MKKIEIGNVLSQAWELTKKSWLTVLVCLIGMWAVEQVVSALFGTSAMSTALAQNIQRHADDINLILSQISDCSATLASASFISMLAKFIVMVGFMQTLLNIVRGKTEFAFNAWKQSVNVYAKVILTGIVVVFIAFVGFCFCILPGIYFYARLEYAGYYLLDHQEAGIGEAISASWNMTSEDGLSLSLLQVVYFLICCVGLCLCCIGIVPALILVYLSDVVCYSLLAPAPAAPKEDQPVAE